MQEPEKLEKSREWKRARNRETGECLKMEMELTATPSPIDAMKEISSGERSPIIVPVLRSDFTRGQLNVFLQTKGTP